MLSSFLHYYDKENKQSNTSSTKTELFLSNTIVYNLTMYMHIQQQSTKFLQGAGMARKLCTGLFDGEKLSCEVISGN